MSRYCTKCGARLEDNARFCTSCGQMIESLPEQQPQQPVPETPQTPVWTPPVPTDTGNWTQPAPTDTGNWTQPQVTDNQNVTQSWDPDQPTGDPNWNPDPPEQPEVPQQPPYAPYPGQPPYQGPQNNNQGGGKQISKGALVGILCGVLAVIAAVVVIVLLSNRTATIDLDKYYQVTFSGYDGYGSAQVTFDSAKLLEDYEDEFKTPQLAQEFVSFAQYLPTLSKSYDLKNDETVTLQWDLSEENLEGWKKYYGVGIKCENKEIKVAGLEAIGTIDAFASVDVTFEGNDGSGYARLQQKDDDYYSAFYFEADKYDHLSNGDKITVTCNYDEAWMAERYGKVPAAATKEYTVEGLGEIRTVDPFEYVEISYEGVSPELTAYAKFKDDTPEEITGAVYIDTSYFYDLKNGGEFTVEIKSWYEADAMAEYYGIAIDNWTKTYTVESEQEYITKLSQIDDATLKRLQEIADKEIAERTESEFSDSIKMDDHSYVGLYLMTPKNEDQYYSQQNYLYVLYKIDISTTEGGSGSYYYYLGFENLILNNADGTITFRDDYYNTPYSTVRAGDTYLSGYDTIDTFYQSAIEYNSESYNFETNVE